MSALITRKLTTILAADAERFSSAMEQDELGTYGDLKAARRVFFKFIERHGGRVANTAGDGLIADFPSVVEAVQCAVEVQQELMSDDNGLSFRIGVHLGDVICDGDDLIGEGVNLAARLQSLAAPNGILISRQVHDQVHNKLGVGFEYLGERSAKNLPQEISVYRITDTGAQDHEIDRVKPRRTPQSSRISQVSKVWEDPEFDHNDASSGPSFAEQSETAPDGDGPALQATGTRFQDKHIKWGIGAVAGSVVINTLSGGGFWLAWPLLVCALLVGLRHGEEIVGRSHFKHIPLKYWTIATFLIGVNLMSFSGKFWSIVPIAALLLGGWLLSRNQAKE